MDDPVQVTDVDAELQRRGDHDDAVLAGGEGFSARRRSSRESELWETNVVIPNSLRAAPSRSTRARLSAKTSRFSPRCRREMMTVAAFATLPTWSKTTSAGDPAPTPEAPAGDNKPRAPTALSHPSQQDVRIADGGGYRPACSTWPGRELQRFGLSSHVTADAGQSQPGLPGSCATTRRSPGFQARSLPSAGLRCCIVHGSATPSTRGDRHSHPGQAEPPGVTVEEVGGITFVTHRISPAPGS